MTTAPTARSSNFYPRPPRGGRHVVVILVLMHFVISIHALREEGDRWGFGCAPIAKMISIHALREEGDAARVVLPAALQDFYPRPPRGGRLLRDDPRHRYK